MRTARSATLRSTALCESPRWASVCFKTLAARCPKLGLLKSANSAAAASATSGRRRAESMSKKFSAASGSASMTRGMPMTSDAARPGSSFATGPSSSCFSARRELSGSLSSVATKETPARRHSVGERLGSSATSISSRRLG